MDNKISVHLRVKLKAHLKKPLQRIIKQKDLEDWKLLIEDVAKELDISILHCAAAIAQLNESNFQRRRVIKEVTAPLPVQEPRSAKTDKMVPYRLEIGFNHQVSIDRLKQFLVDEAGVERDKIQIVDFSANSTQVSLPEGMPNDIFKHLKSVCLNRKPLKISCLEGGKEGTVKSFKKRPNRRPKKNWNKVKNNQVKEER